MTVDLVHELRQQLLLAPDDRRRLELYRNALPRILATDAAQGILLAGDAQYLAIRRHDILAQAEILRHRGLAYLQMHTPVKALSDLRDAYSLYSSLADEREHTWRTERAGLAVSIGRAHFSLDEPHTALHWYRAAIEECGESRLPPYGEALEELGHLFRTTGNYTEAFQHLFQSLSIREELGSPDDTGLTLLAIGTTFDQMGDHETAYDYYSRSLGTFRSSGNSGLEVRALTHLANIHHRRGKPDQAIHMALTAFTIYHAIGDHRGASEIMATIGDIQEELEKFDMAFEYYLRAYRILPAHAEDAIRLPILLRVGRIHHRIGDLDAALLVMQWALEIATDTGNRQVQYQIHESIATVFETLGHYQQALEHHKIFAALRHELAGEEQRRTIAELQVKFDLGTAKRELDDAQRHASTLEASMKTQQDELTATIMNLTQKSKTLEELREKAVQLRGRIESGQDQTLVNEIIAEINANRTADEDWKRFANQLNKVYPDFIRNIVQICPHLTSSEIRICMLTKLGLSTKQISASLGTSTRTVETQRLRIRKKLQMEKSLNFGAFIAGL